MKFGVHTSVRKGFVGALDEAAQLGCTAFQMFTQSPRGWKTRVYTDQEFKEFRETQTNKKLYPAVVHAPYLPNLCTSDSLLYERSVRSLKSDLGRCEKLGSPYLVIHPGAYSPESDQKTGFSKIISALNSVLDSIPGKSKILIENMAGGGRRLGSRFSELNKMIQGVNQKNRIGICFDTCHALAAGYDVSNVNGVKSMVDELDREIGLKHIHVFHVNDSKTPLNSHRDRHEHLGKGHVGLKGLKILFSQKEFRESVFILETPKDTPTADKENLKVLRSLLDD